MIFIRRIEVMSVRHFFINFETGYLVLNVRTFFPTTERKSRQIAKFISDHCSKKEVAELLKELRNDVEFMHREEVKQRDKIPLTTTSTGKAFHARQARVADSIQKRLERDIKNIEEAWHEQI